MPRFKTVAWVFILPPPAWDNEHSLNFFCVKKNDFKKCFTNFELRGIYCPPLAKVGCTTKRNVQAGMDKDLLT